MNAPIRTARFWTWINDSWTRLTVREDRPLHWHRWYRHEEGWASETHTWTLADGFVTDEDAADGRDCDTVPTSTSQRWRTLLHSRTMTTIPTNAKSPAIRLRRREDVWAIRDLCRLIEQQTGEKCFLADAVAVAVREAIAARQGAPKAGPTQDAPPSI